MTDERLSGVIAQALGELEREGELVVATPSIIFIADRIAEAALSVVPNTSLSLQELSGIRSLILHAVSDKQFFDWEVPTLTGYTAEEFKLIAQKLPLE